MSPESLALPARPLGAPGAAGPVHVRWLGTAGFEIRHAGHVVLLDPYLTRASLGRCIASTLAPDEAAIARHVDRADAIVVGHTHFDHALDVPAIARRTGAVVFGSRSAATLCRLAGLPERQIRDVQPGPGEPATVAEVGPFRLSFVPSEHARLVLGRVPFDGDIDDCDRVPMRTERYRCGAVFGARIEVAGRTIFHLGSANLVDAAVPRDETDLLLCCVAGWTQTARFPERVRAAFSPRAVLLSHWDHFFRPLERPARALPAMRMPELADRLAGAARESRVGTVPLLGAVEL